GMPDVSAEGIRLTVVNYAASAMMRTDSPKEAEKMLAVMDAFSKPCASSEKLAPVLLAVGALLNN
ncbi:hypothetical protein KW797_03230, partial [Candidatus Parcubacteria bacterium]|nr:hypothetical protein [Candidatus Parcubacteria bacterium]